MAERRLLTDDVGMEHTVVCGLDANSRNAPIRFAGCLARRLGWRLSLVPLPEDATEDERLGRLLAVSTRDQAGFVVTEAVRSGADAAALIELARGAACPLIAVPRGAPALGTGPILCGIDGGGPLGPTARAASRLANAVDARLRLVHAGALKLGRREDAALLAVGAASGDAAGQDGVAAAVLRDSPVPVMVVPDGPAVTCSSKAA
jgi:nucleotide-binding universal stress UspA family protein